MIPIDFLAEASDDFNLSFDWYLERSPRAAGNFANAVDASLHRISTSPEQF